MKYIFCFEVLRPLVEEHGHIVHMKNMVTPFSNLKIFGNFCWFFTNFADFLLYLSTSAKFAKVY